MGSLMQELDLFLRVAIIFVWVIGICFAGLLGILAWCTLEIRLLRQQRNTFIRYHDQSEYLKV